jgi:hypothetical protein
MSPLRIHSLYCNLGKFGRSSLLSYCHTPLPWYKALCVVESAKKEPINLPPARLQQRDITTSFERPQMEHYQKSGSVALMVVIKRCCNLAGGKLMGSFLDDLTT